MKLPVSRGTLGTLVSIVALAVTVGLALWSAALSIRYATQTEDTLALIGRKVMDESKRWAIPRSNNHNVLLLIKRSDSLWLSRDSAGQITTLEDALRLEPGNASAHQRLGLAYGVRGGVSHDADDFRRALIHYDAALEHQNELGGEPTLWTKSLRRGTKIELGETTVYPTEFKTACWVLGIIVVMFLAGGIWLAYDDISLRRRKQLASKTEEVC